MSLKQIYFEQRFLTIVFLNFMFIFRTERKNC